MENSPARRMPRLAALGFCFVAMACSSGNSGAGSPGTCSTANGCDPDRCTCADGHQEDTSTTCRAGVCSTGGTSECMQRCAGHGGFASIAPAPNVAASPECDAFCNKIASLGCANAMCDRYFWCLVPPGQCEASVRAQLACSAQMEMFMCLQGGWSGTGGCEPQSSMCGGDAGTD